MNVSAAVSSRYAAISAASGLSVYAAKNTASEASFAADPSTQSSSPDVVVTLSSKALDLMQRRQISAENAEQFKDILAKASAANAQANPKAFLNDLSSSDMEVLRQVHCLADSITISTLTHEGAANLLVQPGSEQDLDNNGLTSVGAGNSITFPPSNAPESFKAAWAAASEGMSPLDIPPHMIFAVSLANIGLEPGDPNWRNPYADPGFDYKSAVSNSIDALKFSYERGGISTERFQNSMDFYTRLSEAMNWSLS